MRVVEKVALVIDVIVYLISQTACSDQNGCHKKAQSITQSDTK